MDGTFRPWGVLLDALPYWANNIHVMVWDKQTNEQPKQRNRIIWTDPLWKIDDCESCCRASLPSCKTPGVTALARDKRGPWTVQKHSLNPSIIPTMSLCTVFPADLGWYGSPWTPIQNDKHHQEYFTLAADLAHTLINQIKYKENMTEKAMGEGIRFPSTTRRKITWKTDIVSSSWHYQDHWDVVCSWRSRLTIEFAFESADCKAALEYMRWDIAMRSPIALKSPRILFVHGINSVTDMLQSSKYFNGK